MKRELTTKTRMRQKNVGGRGLTKMFGLTKNTTDALKMYILIISTTPYHIKSGTPIIILKQTQLVNGHLTVCG